MKTIKKRGGYRGGIKPTLPLNKKRKAVTIKLPPDLIDKIKQRGSLTAIIEQELNKYLAKSIDN